MKKKSFSKRWKESYVTRILIVYVLFLVALGAQLGSCAERNRLNHEKPKVEEDPFKECRAFCAKQDAGIAQDSDGLCACNSKEGLKAQKGYHLYLNNQCEE